MAFPCQAKPHSASVACNCWAAWPVSAYFTERERAAQACTESRVDVAASHAPDADFEPLKAYFSDAEIADLSVAIALMSAFKRLAIGMHQ